jgi:hypothetical protein
MKINTSVSRPRPTTHEGAPAAFTPSAADELRRAVMACMLWEDQFYEAGADIAQRIADLVRRTDPTECMEIAVEARHNMKLRHAPLLVVREMARLPEHKALVAHTLEAVVERPDELPEFLAIYWKDGKQPLSAQVKKGLARAFAKFSEYQLAKYDRDGAVRLRDVMFLSHAKPADAVKKYTKAERAAKVRHKLTPGETLYKKVVDGALATPDTWEVALSGGADKKVTFERLISEGKLGGLALLRNLRNLRDAGVDRSLLEFALSAMSVERVLPFRFLAAARAVPEYEDIIEPAMLRCLEGREKLPGHTAVLVDVSGSMSSKVSGKSELSRVDAAAALAVLARELCEQVTVMTFSNQLIAVAPRRGFALVDAVLRSQPHGGTYLGAAVAQAIEHVRPDRLIVVTDEQSMDPVDAPECEGWMINVASYQNGVGYGAWNRIDGWSESVLDYIIARSVA